jgi:hypothetical protein
MQQDPEAEDAKGQAAGRPSDGSVQHALQVRIFFSFLGQSSRLIRFDAQFLRRVHLQGQEVQREEGDGSG